MPLTQGGQYADVYVVPVSTSTVVLRPVSNDRFQLMVYNDSQANLFVKFGPGASSGSFTAKLEPGDFFEAPTPVYTGQVTGVWSDQVSGNAMITEVS